EADMAIGGDQGGSVRIPASWCGIYGLKPTWGLVPYTGAFPIEPTLDHLGPMARTVTDIAQMLSVIAGPDGRDPRQLNPVPVHDYMAAAQQPARGLRVGLLQEGFGWPQSEAAVDDMVRTQAEALTSQGVSVASVSMPAHRTAMMIWNGIAVEGAWTLMMSGNAVGYGYKDAYDEQLLELWGTQWRRAPGDLPITVQQMMLIARYWQTTSPGRFYAKAQNLARELTMSYDALFETVDVLIMPTTPMTATLLPSRQDPITVQLTRAFEMVVNTAPFDISGHPALTVPCGFIEGLPVGMMMVGRRGEETALLRLAATFEQTIFAISSLPVLVK
ncbi:MAG: amidase family protein, partial [Firmicutes bacterium]|nr:amidase family protein [Bacillota bacterium]